MLILLITALELNFASQVQVGVWKPAETRSTEQNQNRNEENLWSPSLPCWALPSWARTRVQCSDMFITTSGCSSTDTLPVAPEDAMTFDRFTCCSCSSCPPSSTSMAHDYRLVAMPDRANGRQWRELFFSKAVGRAELFVFVVVS